nr:MAG TPA: hypothetical protein [Caudoviricetes sp.]
MHEFGKLICPVQSPYRIGLFPVERANVVRCTRTGNTSNRLQVSA